VGLQNKASRLKNRQHQSKWHKDKRWELEAELASRKTNSIVLKNKSILKYFGSFYLFMFVLLGRVSCYILQVHLKIMIFLPHSLESSDYMSVLSTCKIHDVGTPFLEMSTSCMVADHLKFYNFLGVSKFQTK
jgi:hypothetical protein